MRTQKSKLYKLNAVLLILMIFIGLAFSACEKETDIFPTNTTEAEVFNIGPEGGIILAQNHEVFIRVPEGAFLEPTEIMISHKKGVKYESYILMNKCYFISIANEQLLEPITLWLNYDSEELCLGSRDENCLEIFAYCKNNSGTITKSDCFQSIGDCCVDPISKTVNACYSKLGYFVVGRKY